MGIGVREQFSLGGQASWAEFEESKKGEGYIYILYACIYMYWANVHVPTNGTNSRHLQSLAKVYFPLYKTTFIYNANKT